MAILENNIFAKNEVNEIGWAIRGIVTDTSEIELNLTNAKGELTGPPKLE